jgi:hypothetical protein
MRNLLLGLILANLLLLAWQVWVDPSSPAAPGGEADGLVLYGDGKAAVAKPAPGGQAAPAAAADGTAAAFAPGACFRLGPLPDSAAAQQTAQGLAARGIDATPIARDAQLWLGHWVQISGFDSLPAAESARDRLVAGGIADALLMQDGPQPMISLGVFRDPDRADRVANAARELGFEVAIRDRYRPGVEQWLVIRPRAGQTLLPADLGLARDRIMRAEPVPCGDAGGAATAPESDPAGLDGELLDPEPPEQPL